MYILIKLTSGVLVCVCVFIIFIYTYNVSHTYVSALLVQKVVVILLIAHYDQRISQSVNQCDHMPNTN